MNNPSALQQEIIEAIAPLHNEIACLRQEVKELKSAQEDDSLIPLEEAAKKLNVCKATLRRKVKSGMIPCIRPGGHKMYFHPEAIEQVIQSSRKAKSSAVSL